MLVTFRLDLGLVSLREVRLFEERDVDAQLTSVVSAHDPLAGVFDNGFGWQPRTRCGETRYGQRPDCTWASGV